MITDLPTKAHLSAITVTNICQSFYLQDGGKNNCHRRRLRSASTEQFDVLTCHQSTIGGRAFPVAGAEVWNSLPSDVTSASSLSVFKNRLKTYLFHRCYGTV